MWLHGTINLSMNKKGQQRDGARWPNISLNGKVQGAQGEQYAEWCCPQSTECPTQRSIPPQRSTPCVAREAHPHGTAFLLQRSTSPHKNCPLGWECSIQRSTPHQRSTLSLSCNCTTQRQIQNRLWVPQKCKPGASRITCSFSGPPDATGASSHRYNTYR